MKILQRNKFTFNTMMRVNKQRIIWARSSPGKTWSPSRVEEPGYCYDDWATGTCRYWTRDKKYPQSIPRA